MAEFQTYIASSRLVNFLSLYDFSFNAAINADINELSYEIMTIEKTDSKKIAATGREEIEEKASGKIVIFNDFNTSSQRLIKNTRFETPEGLIYRINKSIIVPGQKTEGGKTVPGSIEATVYADEAGEKYNIGLTDFTIPGFEGSPRFDSFYARSKTEMAGGFAGERLSANPDELKKAQDELRTELKKQLMAEAFSQIPDEFYPWPANVKIPDSKINRKLLAANLTRNSPPFKAGMRISSARQ